MDIAIVAVAYNRVDSLTRLLNSLDNAFYGEDKPTLIISIDKSKTDVVERFADSYEWKHGEIIVDKHEQNFGLRKHMMSLGKWFEQFDAIVVLEDDIVVSPNFYSYTKYTVEKYHKCPEIAGISLYSFSVNYQKGLPFVPIKDEHDVYFMQCAMSWGEVWMRDSWHKFYDWYLNHQDFPVMPQLPYAICSWNGKSWLKYHTRYCIEENKFFVHPYTSLTSNYGDAGEHSDGGANTMYQVSIQLGRKENYSLPNYGEEAVYYDGFFENITLYQKLGMNSENLCLDLNGEWNNRLNKQNWLTTQVLDFKIVKSYGMNYRPIELNVILDNPGRQLYLYDTSVVEKNTNKKRRDLLLYHYKLSNVFFFVRRYGYMNTLKDIVVAVKNKFGKFNHRHNGLKIMIKKYLKIVLYPIVLLRRWCMEQQEIDRGIKNPKAVASQRYKAVMGKELDWENPQDLNEKINWMKFNTDLSEWTRLSDKYLVRDYLKERGREDLLVKLYGVWNNANDIDFNELPDKFVLKSNHGCGTIILVEDKTTLDTVRIRRQMNDWLNSSYGIVTAEPQYTKIKPRIIAEELLENDNPSSTSLIDYKVFCLEGEPYCIMVCANRIIGKGMQTAFYDLEWNAKPDMLAGDHKDDRIDIPKPVCLDELIQAARELAKGHPFVRADFYITHDKVYFGEMTFTPKGGYTDTITYSYLLEMGKKIPISIT